MARYNVSTFDNLTGLQGVVDVINWHTYGGFVLGFFMLIYFVIIYRLIKFENMDTYKALLSASGIMFIPSIIMSTRVFLSEPLLNTNITLLLVGVIAISGVMTYIKR